MNAKTSYTSKETHAATTKKTNTHTQTHTHAHTPTNKTKQKTTKQPTPNSVCTSTSKRIEEITNMIFKILLKSTMIIYGCTKNNKCPCICLRLLEKVILFNNI